MSLLKKKGQQEPNQIKFDKRKDLVGCQVINDFQY